MLDRQRKTFEGGRGKKGRMEEKARLRAKSTEEIIDNNRNRWGIGLNENRKRT